MRARALRERPGGAFARARPTTRGTTVALVGAILVGVGVALGLPDVVTLGAAGVLVVAAAWVWMSAHRVDRGRGALRVARRMEPNPAVRGQTTTTRLAVTAARPSASAYGRLTRLRISEQAASELCDSGSLRAQVAVTGDRIAVRYHLHPVRRGRWPLGPLLTTQVDVFGLVRTTQTLGAATQVAVWPRTVELPVRGSRSFGAFERNAQGAKLSSTDDTVLRDYVTGDDPRRVHWASAARRGQLMVRSDESAGLAPVTVVLDRGMLPPPTADHTDLLHGEWGVECAASVALSLLRAGHPTRLVTSSTAPVVDATPHSTGRGSHGQGEILDQTLDLRGHRSEAAAERAVTATAEALRRARRPGEITVAVLGPLGSVARQAVAAMAGDGPHHAIVRVPPASSRRTDDARATVAVLRATGWHVAEVDHGTGIEHAWARIAEGRR